MTDWSTIAAAIGAATGQIFSLKSLESISGGWINQAYYIDGHDGRRFFIKLNSADNYEIFATEVAALREIAGTHTIRVPNPVVHGIADTQCFLVLEHLDLSKHGDECLLGTQLAEMHRCTGHRFGLSRDNFIGTTIQKNGWSDDWIVFWGEKRLKFQLGLASENGYGDTLGGLGMQLLVVFPAFFEGYSPQPTLLHGDLWGGNHGFLADGTPVIFDPASYYGDRESDLAMTELFGGYSGKFYGAYRAAYPLHEGYPLRRDLYNLYHLLNHANMFGGVYVQQAEGMMRRLLENAP